MTEEVLKVKGAVQHLLRLDKTAEVWILVPKADSPSSKPEDWEKILPSAKADSP